jgi:broad specificity phosphatase PhoE
VSKQLIIIRHARSKLNVRVSEDLDCGITDYGFHQAKNVGKFLSKHVDLTGSYFFTSPFLRCLQTAGSIAEQFVGPITFQIDWRVREYINHAGREVHVPRRSNEPGIIGNYQDTTFKDESNEEFLNRICSFHSDLPDSSVVVTHGLPAMLLLHVATHTNVNYVPIWDHSIDNCSITLIKNGRLIWMGRNLCHEIKEDIFEKVRPFDQADLLIP